MQEKVHVLIGEDDPNDRLLLEKAFRKVWPDVQVDLFPSGAAVVDHLQAEPSSAPSLIILDTLTSHMTGWEVMEWLQNHPTFSRVPVVMFSGQVKASDRALAERLGAKGYFEKPHDTSDLFALIKELGKFWAG